jgi:hypothetical protein
LAATATISLQVINSLYQKFVVAELVEEYQQLPEATSVAREA